MYCRTFGIYQSSLMSFVPQCRWSQVSHSGLWFVRWQENSPQSYVISFFVVVDCFQPPYLKFSLCLNKKEISILALNFWESFPPLLLDTWFWFCSSDFFWWKCQVLKIQKISSCFLSVRYLQLLLTHQAVILWPKSLNPSHSLMVSKIFSNGS